MRDYKDSPDDAVRARHGAQVASMVGRFLKHHRVCIEEAAGASFDSIVVVPSTRARAGPHPLEAAVGRVTSLKGLVQPLLGPGTSPITGHLQAKPNGYVAVGEVSGRAVLLLDDTFTSGARVQSAAHALATGGATVVATLVVGRVIDPGFNDESKALWDTARAQPFSFDTCCLE
jgi:phosphoribosylpyrophosphate synthetase